MAAVAGSKGRIHLADDLTPIPSFQAELAGNLLAGKTTVSEVARLLLDHARLREVGIDTNMICNLSCKYCYLDDRDESKGRIDPKAWASYIEPLVGAGCKLVAFIGKEPLGDTIALDTIGRLNRLPTRQSFRVGMVTNGTFIDRRIDQLADARLDYLDVSLDAVGAVNDELRGEGVFQRVSKNLKLYLATAPAHDFSVTSVLHKGSAERYVEFVDFLFSLGMKTAFGSPILKFTEKDPVSRFALNVGELRSLLEQLSAYLSSISLTVRADRQIIIDLPYKYSWALLQSAGFDWKDINQDTYEAHYWRPDSALPLYIKFNFFPMSYWRAIRVTHDGRVLENMDLAAHRLYRQESRPCSDTDNRWYFGRQSLYHHEFLRDFVDQHARVTGHTLGVYDREVAAQLRHLVATARAA